MFKYESHLFLCTPSGWLIAAWWRRMALKHLVLVHNGLPPNRPQAIPWSNSDMLSIGPSVFSLQQDTCNVSSNRDTCSDSNVYVIACGDINMFASDHDIQLIYNYIPQCKCVEQI